MRTNRLFKEKFKKHPFLPIMKEQVGKGSPSRERGEFQRNEKHSTLCTRGI